MNVGLNIRLNKTEQAVVSLLISNPDKTAVKLAAETGVTKRTIERALVSLQNKGILIRVGSKRDGIRKS